VVSVVCDGDAAVCRFELCPNRSLSPRGARVFFLGMCCLSLGIAAGFALLGAWPVLPFAGLELAFLGGVLYRVGRQAEETDVVTVTPEHVRVVANRNRTVRSWTLQRYWARVRLRGERAGWYPKRLFIASHGRELEIGRMLCEQERERVAKDLATMLALPHAISPVAA
jgi:uncharacterized membrane protein